MRLMPLMSLILPLPQSGEFARACEVLGQPLRRHRREAGGQTRMVWQVQSRRLGPLGRVDLVSRGPVAAATDDLRDWSEGWRRWHDGRPLLLNADGMTCQMLRAAGFWPLMTPASLALLPLGDVTDMRAALAQKWRNRLNRAKREDLHVTERELTADHWLLQAEAAQAKARRYRGLPAVFAQAFAAANPGQARVFEAQHRGAPLAAALMLRHGRMATWQIGVTTAEGRRRHAMNLILWHAMQSLAAQGHEVLDLGILNAQDAPGLTHFKLGTGARLHRLGGTWLHMGALAPLARHLPARLAA
ncbi:GNAT family N-acetyltransferase [Mameliella alba]|nr:GNAT family N-acetyltransferase [Mameliella alba]